MRATREASDEILRSSLVGRIAEFVRQGVTTLEIKTGYALDQQHELRCLRLLNEKFQIPIVPTYLGAHSIPPEFSTAREYLQFIESTMLPLIRGLTSRVDIFIERGFFDFDEGLDFLSKAKQMGFQTTVHADQLSLSGGTDAAMAIGAKSADHVIMLDSERIAELGKTEVTAVLLPMADLYMKCAYPKAREMIAKGCRVALATDFNPGSCPSQDLALVGLLARLEMKMTLPEVIAAYTVGASHTLGLESLVGSLEVGKDANFICINSDWDQLFYSAGNMPVTRRFVLGSEI